MNSWRGKSSSIIEWILIIFLAVLPGLSFYLFLPRSNLLTGKEKVTTAKIVSTDNFFKKMEAELETTKNGDILETRWIGEWEGSRTFLVVTQDSRDGRVYYQVKGGSVMLQSSSELAQRIVNVYRVGTPEWREKLEVFMKQ